MFAPLFYDKTKQIPIQFHWNMQEQLIYPCPLTLAGAHCAPLEHAEYVRYERRSSAPSSGLYGTKQTRWSSGQVNKNSLKVNFRVNSEAHTLSLFIMVYYYDIVILKRSIYT